MARHFLLVLMLALGACAVAQAPPQDKDQQQPTAPATSQPPPRSEPLPSQRGPGDSSSRDDSSSRGNPPMSAPDEAQPDDSVTELHSWDPHRAMKDVEVGNYYFKLKNYSAALSRYCEALSYKPNDAVATFRIAESLEQCDDLAGARTYYEAYLKILPAGPMAAKSKKALERIKAQAAPSSRHLAEKEGCEQPGKAVRFRPEVQDPDRPVLSRNPGSSGKVQ
jgi:tetratricopeptide (TPR) repeat protein